ncbi:hypothetical protein [Bulleidia sp. zg-1006]|uniref:methyltransferase RsmF C-terminal domain-like protein n=1 Tax=Bulleidia sp. zg-1006 TaxID=2806552 RepID=UPI00193AB22B|nr:hypothetical protein [Bulleidia sp. zg-1006]QRG87325.1 hypothetical protein JOS54_03180 [Bulleidia sp. zg-1006]
MGLDLPQEFLKRMQAMLGKEYDAFKEAYQKPYHRHARFNSLKVDDFPSDVRDWLLKRSPFCLNGAYLKEGIQPIQIASYRNGGFYMQEASASSVVALLNIQKGEYVLDMCAAPGSKSTQIGEYLKQEGLLVSNEYVSKRAMILLENIIRHGLQNAIVLNCDTKLLAQEFPSGFDKILVDAPCSGEGLFLKQESSVQEWSLDNISLCAKRQAEILENAYICLRKGGNLLYSTCTFAKEENEDQIAAFLKKHEDMELIPIEVNFGRPGFSPFPQTRRIFPMDGGSGHFMALLHKKGMETRRIWKTIPTKNEHFYQEEVNKLLHQPYRYFHEFQGKLYAGNELFLDSQSLRIVRQMICVGEIRNKRLIFDHHFFMASSLKKERKIDINEEQYQHYIHGDTLAILKPKGYYGVCYRGLVVGGCRSDGQQLKNLYPKAWRTR